MAIIDSVKLPDNSTYDLTDNYSGYQKETLATPLTINGDTETTVEGALGGLNDYGDALADNLAANENVYGAKNLLDINNLGSMSAYKCHVANNGFVNDETDTLDYFRLRLVAYDSNSQIIQVGGNNYVFSENVTTTGQKEITGFTLPAGTANVLLTHTGANINIYVNPTVNLDIIEIPLTLSFNANGINPSSIGGLDIRDIMLRDARVIDHTFVPYAKTNLQLTNDKAERADLSTIHATGSTNTTGVQIDAGTFFYLNEVYCKAKTNIAANATFTLNTNFEVTSVGKELKDALDYSGVYIFDATPGYEGWGGLYVPTPLPIPAKLLSDYTVTISDIQIGRNNGANITLPINSLDIYEKTHGGTNITRTLIDYFQSTSPVYSSFVALRDANATILVKLSVAHT